MLKFLNTIIRWSFYGIFLFVPLALWPDTSELFEFNKLWITYIFAIIIAVSWSCKIILQKRIFIQKTPLDIPILLFLLTQIISTIFSLDPYVSWWGYYSRFNGGLLSIISYIFLYYAFVSNSSSTTLNSLNQTQNTNSETVLNAEAKKFVMNILKISLFSGLITVLWGLPSHFGYDPTCFLFRGQFNVDCWTSGFQPKIRIFSTLGQPDWFAAYLSILIPIALAFGFINLYSKTQSNNKKKSSNWWLVASYLLLTTIYYIDFLYTRSKGSFLAQIISFVVFFGGIITIYFKKNIKYYILDSQTKILAGVILLIVLITFFLNTPFSQLYSFTFDGIKEKLFSHSPSISSQIVNTAKNRNQKANMIVGEGGGTDSGKIRAYVWKGAIEAWKHYPLIGTGVETFAYAYYKFRPQGHNLTSEWDYLYNKAHNEYLNYLTTTGIFGLGTYLVVIALFLYFCFKNLFRISDSESQILILALLSAYVSIVISNFFGFSVVIVNLYFFIIPTIIFILTNKINSNSLLAFPLQKSEKSKVYMHSGTIQKILLFLIAFIGVYLILVLANYWQADRSYGLGANLDHANAYDQAGTSLRNAVTSRPDEPVYKDELSSNDATLAVLYASQKDPSAKNTAQQLAQEAIQLNDDVISAHPNSLVYWKSRIKIYYSLSQLNPNFLPLAVTAAERAQYLAPTDAKINYNLGLLYSQANNLDKSIETLRKTIAMKSDYRDAHFALGVLLHQKALDKNGKIIINTDMQKEAVKNIRYLLLLSDTDKQAIDMLKSWGETP